jgi:AcrR family transcriptional regulator
MVKPALAKAGKATQDSAPAESVRARILTTARELFYREGARSVGVDTVVAQSGVAKTSLYRWFPSKDALIGAVLEQEAADRWAGWDAVMQRAEPDARSQLRAQLAGIVKFTSHPRYRGCPFMNVSAEFPDQNHPGRLVAKELTEELRRRLRGLVDQLGVANPEELSEQLVLLIDGAFSVAQVLGSEGPQKYLVQTADALIDAQVAKGK